MRFNSLATTASILVLAGGVNACGGAKDQGPNPPQRVPVEKVPLKKELSVEQQAKQVEAAVNAGKQVTGLTVEYGYDLPVEPGQVPGNCNIISVGSPIKLKSNVYAYAIDRPDRPGVDVGLIRYTGKLKISPEVGGAPPQPSSPFEAKATLSPVYSEFPLKDGTSDRYYVLSANQRPGPYYNENTRSAGQVAVLATGPELFDTPSGCNDDERPSDSANGSPV